MEVNPGLSTTVPLALNVSPPPVSKALVFLQGAARDTAARQ